MTESVHTDAGLREEESCGKHPDAAPGLATITQRVGQVRSAADRQGSEVTTGRTHTWTSCSRTANRRRDVLKQVKYLLMCVKPHLKDHDVPLLPSKRTKEVRKQLQHRGGGVAPVLELHREERSGRLEEDGINGGSAASISQEDQFRSNEH